MKKKAKKSAGKKAAKGRKTRAAKTAPKESLGDRLLEKNLANLNKEVEGDLENLPALKKAIAGNPELHMGALLLVQLTVLTAETQTVRQLLEASVVAKATRGNAEPNEVFRQLEELVEKLR